MPKLALLYSGRLGHIAKLAGALVVEKAVAFKRRDVNILAAVVVVIRDGNTHRVHLDIQAAARGDIRERAIAIVLIQRGKRLRPRGVKSLLLSSRMSGQPSPSASKNAAPEPIVSGRYFFPARPLLWVKLMPAADVTSVNVNSRACRTTNRQERKRMQSHRSVTRFRDRGSSGAHCYLPG